MTTLLDEAIEKVRAMPDADQNRAAEVMFAVAERHTYVSPLTAEQIEEVRRIQADLASGKERLLTDEELAEMWREFGS